MRAGTWIGRRSGFTVIELLVVLLVVSLLVSLATPVVSEAILRAREAALKEDLFVMRKAIDGYYADNGKYPPSLEALVESKYIRTVPKDPFTGVDSSWHLEWTDGEEETVGIFNIFSGADGRSQNGELLREL